MRRTSVESSFLVAIGYDRRSKVLEVEFDSGRVYRYFWVPPEVHAALMAADSHGSYFDGHIRGIYDYARLR